MNTQQQQAYLEGFVKRASEYGYSEQQAINILKQATAADAPALQQAPSFMQGLKNLAANSNPMTQLAGVYHGLMGNDKALNYPIATPYMTGGDVGTPGIKGIPHRLMNAMRYMGDHGTGFPVVTTPASATQPK